MKTLDGFIDNGGVHIHYERAGWGEKALVCLHGASDDARCWGTVVDALAADADLVLPDARGHGQSDAPEDGYDLETLAADLAAVIKGLEFASPIVLGHSLGASIALALAGLEPDLLRAVILEDPPAIWQMVSLPSVVADVPESLVEAVLELQHTPREHLRYQVFAQHPTWQATDIEPWLDAKSRFSTRAVPLVCEAHLASIDMPAVMSAIRCPVVVLHGETWLGSLPTSADLTALRSLLPTVEIIAIRGAGHDIRRDQPGEYVRTLKAVLGRLWTQS
jgi:N-formylmaleamate deformylase